MNTRLRNILFGVGWAVVCAALIVASIPRTTAPSPSIPAPVQPPTPVVQPVTNPDINPNGSVWDGLPEANPKLIDQLRSDEAYTAIGQPVSLSLNRPILFFAPWCNYCHELLGLLSQNHLQDKVQIVGIQIGKKDAPTPVKTIGDAVANVQYNLQRAGVHISPQSIYYAMPGSALDGVLTRHPTVLIPHDGHWYVQNGYNPDVSFWQQILA